MHNVVQLLMEELRKCGNVNTALSSQRFFKEQIKTYGVTTPQANKLAKKYLKSIKDAGPDRVFELCDLLWQSGYIEEGMVACHWAYSQRKHFEPKHFAVFEHWVFNYITNWATCDTLCNHTIGDFITMHPHELERLLAWANSPNRWVRRASAVTLIIPARKGQFHSTIFGIAQALLLDPDDLVQKGYGWLLKSASQWDEQAVFEFVMSHKSEMPRTALRYAIEKMSPAHRAMAMAKQC